MSKSNSQKTVAVIGAGPIGIETHVALKNKGFKVIHFDRGCIGATISWFPDNMTFFSSNDRIAIAGVPIPKHTQTKTTKEEFLAYLLSVCEQYNLIINTFESVESVLPHEGVYQIMTQTLEGEAYYHADAIVFCTGDMHHANTLDIPGEELPHVSHYFRNPHQYYGKKVLVVGGKNSAVEATLRSWHAGAKTTISYRKSEFGDHVKYWLKPEIEGRIRRGEIDYKPLTVPVEIEPTRVKLQSVDSEEIQWVDADFVLLLVGYKADNSLLAGAGIELAENQKPVFNPHTMETNVSGVYVAGTATAGTQNSYRVFIETSHVHVNRLIAHLSGEEEPDESTPDDMLES